MSYEVKITSAAHRQLAALPKDILRRIDSKILSLADNPRPPGVKKLKAEETSIASAWVIIVLSIR